MRRAQLRAARGSADLRSVAVQVRAPDPDQPCQRPRSGRDPDTPGRPGERAMPAQVALARTITTDPRTQLPDELSIDDRGTHEGHVEPARHHAAVRDQVFRL